MSRRNVQVDERLGRVHELRSRHVLDGDGPELVVRAVPGERGVCVWERVAGVVLLQDRVCACGGHGDVQDL
jgi:hypothetical protein